MRLAKEMAKARLSGDEKLYKIKKKEHDAYKDLCLKSDEMEV